MFENQSVKTLARLATFLFLFLSGLTVFAEENKPVQSKVASSWVANETKTPGYTSDTTNQIHIGHGTAEYYGPSMKRNYFFDYELKYDTGDKSIHILFLQPLGEKNRDIKLTPNEVKKLLVGLKEFNAWHKKSLVKRGGENGFVRNEDFLFYNDDGIDTIELTFLGENSINFSQKGAIELAAQINAKAINKALKETPSAEKHLEK